MIKGSEERLLLQMRLDMNEAPLNSAIVPVLIMRLDNILVLWIDLTMIAELVSCAAEYHTDVTGMLYRIVYSNGWKTDMRIADDVPNIIYSTHCMESFYGCNKEFCKRKQKGTHRYHA